MKKICFIFWGVVCITAPALLGINTLLAAKPKPVLTVGTKEAPPFSMKTGDGSWTGISIELWDQIAAELNLSYKFRETDLKGLINGLADRTLDLAVAALTITPERENRFDFTHPFHTTGLGIAIKTKNANPWLTVAKRFLSLGFLKVVATLSLLLLLVGILVWWFERRKNAQEFGGGNVDGIGAGFWWSAVTMTTVGYGDKSPKSLGGRIIALIWMFASILVISSFTAAITSSLTVSKLESVIQKPEDLPRVRVGTIADSTSEDYLKYKRINYRPFKTIPQALSALAADQIDAMVYDAPILRYLILHHYQGVLELLPVMVKRQDYGFGLTEGSKLREPMNRVLLRRISDPNWQDILTKYLGTL